MYVCMYCCTDTFDLCRTQPLFDICRHSRSFLLWAFDVCRFVFNPWESSFPLMLPPFGTSLPLLTYRCFSFVPSFCTVTIMRSMRVQVSLILVNTIWLCVFVVVCVSVAENIAHMLLVSYDDDDNMLMTTC